SDPTDAARAHTRPSTTWSTTKVAALLCAVCLAALALRISGIARLLPHAREPDAFVTYEMQDVRGDPALIEDQNYHDRYPMLIAHTLARLPHPDVPAHVDASADYERAHLA